MPSTSPRRHARRPQPRLTCTLALAMTLAFGAAAAPGCGDDKPATPPAGDAGPTPPCKPADCQGIPLPGGICPAGTTPAYTCARSALDMRCAWTLGRCNNDDDALPPPADAADAPIDAPAGDATVDAPADAGADAPDDAPNTDTTPPDAPDDTADAEDATVD